MLPIKLGGQLQVIDLLPIRRRDKDLVNPSPLKTFSQSVVFKGSRGISIKTVDVGSFLSID
jgi:hypothetical protein